MPGCETPPTPTPTTGVTARRNTIAAGADHSLTLRGDGTVWSFGSNLYGQLGTATNSGLSEPNPAPTQVPGLSSVTAIEAGDSHSLALRSDGTVWAFGSNRYGQLGAATHNGLDRPNTAPTQVPGLSEVRELAAGRSHTLALRCDGTVWAFGNNRNGQLGIVTNNGLKEPNPTATRVPGLSDVIAVAAAASHSLALRSDGTVWAFGNNLYGELGTVTNNGVCTANPTATRVPGLSDVIAIAAGDFHSLALRSDGTVRAFGHNFFGQLGTTVNNEADKPNPTPTQVPELCTVTAIIASSFHSLALRSDGAVWAFGYNYFGQLGTAAMNSEVQPKPKLTQAPTQVAGLSAATALAADASHSLALRADGTVWAFGYNFCGQLGTAVYSGPGNPNPAPVPGLIGMAQPTD